MAPDFAEAARAPIEALLEPGETLEGTVAATWQSTFSGRLCALAVTDRRLLLVPLDRHFDPTGEPVSIAPEAVAKASAVGLGDEWWSATITVPAGSALTLRVKTVDGAKYKLQLMHGGDGMLGRLGGGPAQEQGVQALADWFARTGRA